MFMKYNLSTVTTTPTSIYYIVIEEFPPVPVLPISDLPKLIETKGSTIGIARELPETARKLPENGGNCRKQCDNYM